MDIEIQSKNVATKEVTHILVRDVPDDTTQSELIRVHDAYVSHTALGVLQKYDGFNKVAFENDNEIKLDGD